MIHFLPYLADWSFASVPAPHCHHRRAGHTLIEILLALGLSLVILAAAYAALDQHWRYAEAGQRQTERMQVARALFERMSLDLRSVAFRADALSTGLDGIGGTTRNEVVQRADLYVGRSLGIIGDGQKLLLRINAPSDERSTELQTVRWEMCKFEADVRNEKHGTDGHADAAPDSRQDSFGLARIAWRGATLGAAKTVSPKDLLAGEIETIHFRYFARGNWSDHWDSVERQELPRAVEITIGFRRATAADSTTSDKPHPGEYRLIVPVPASEV